MMEEPAPKSKSLELGPGEETPQYQELKVFGSEGKSDYDERKRLQLLEMDDVDEFKRLGFKDKSEFDEYKDAKKLTGQYSVADMKAKFSVATMKAIGYSAADMKGAQVAAAELKAGGYTGLELIGAGYMVQDLKGAGFSAQELKELEVTALDMIKAEFSAKDLRRAGYEAMDLKVAGCHYKELRDACFSLQELGAAGFPLEEKCDVEYSARALGIETKKEYDMFRKSKDYQELKEMGFHLKREYDECKLLGFAAKMPYDECKLLQFEEKDAYDEFKERGFKTKTAYQDYISWRDEGRRGRNSHFRKVVDRIDEALTDSLDINAIDHSSYAPGFGHLHLAVSFRAPSEVLELLIKKGVDVNAWVELRNRFSALHLALRRAAEPISVAILLKNGADVNAVTSDAKTPLQYALSSNAGAETIYLLLLAGADARNYLQFAVESKAPKEVMGLLLAAGAENVYVSMETGQRQLNEVLTHEQQAITLEAAEDSLGKAAVETLLCATKDFLKLFDPHRVQIEVLDRYIAALSNVRGQESSNVGDFVQTAPIQLIPPIIVDGCVGKYASKINGVYVASSDIYNGRQVLVQTFDSNISMRYDFEKNTWCISNQGLNLEYAWCATVNVENPVEPHPETGDELEWIVAGELELNIRVRKHFEKLSLLDAIQIKGCAKEPFAKSINGLYKPTGLNHNRKPLLRKVPVTDEDSDVWMYFEDREKCNDWRVGGSIGDKESAWCNSKEKGLDSPVHAKNWLCKSHKKTFEAANEEMTCKYKVPGDPALITIQVDMKDLSKKSQSLTEDVLKKKILESLDVQIREGSQIIESVKISSDGYGAGIRPAFYFVGVSAYADRPYKPQSSMTNIIDTLKKLLQNKVHQPFLLFRKVMLTDIRSDEIDKYQNVNLRLEEAKALRDATRAVEERSRKDLEEIIPHVRSLQTSVPEVDYLDRFLAYMNGPATELLNDLIYRDAVVQLEAAIEKREQATLEKAIALNVRGRVYQEKFKLLVDEGSSVRRLLHQVTFENARAPIDEAIHKQDRKTLKDTIDATRATELPLGSPEELSAQFNELKKVAQDNLDRLVFEDAKKSLEDAIDARDQEVLERAVESAALVQMPEKYEVEFRKLVEESAQKLIEELEYETALIPLQSAIEKREQKELEKALSDIAVLKDGSHCRDKFDAFVEETKALLDLVILENEVIEGSSILRLYAMNRTDFLDMYERNEGLIVFQDLRRANKLNVLKFNKRDVLTGCLRGKGKDSCMLLAISSPWQAFGDPDSTGERMEAVAKFLRENKQFEYLWWDFMCMPQNTDWIDYRPDKPYPNKYTKNDFEQLYVDTMIDEGGLNLVYVGAYVLSLGNAIYFKRFWTQYEYFLATRAITNTGFEVSYHRSFVSCIQSLKDYAEFQEESMREKWAAVTTEGAVNILKQNDVAVTNKAEKLRLLSLLPSFEEKAKKEYADLPKSMKLVEEKERRSFEQSLLKQNPTSRQQQAIQSQVKSKSSEAEVIKVKVTSQDIINLQQTTGGEMAEIVAMLQQRIIDANEKIKCIQDKIESSKTKSAQEQRRKNRGSAKIHV